MNQETFDIVVSAAPDTPAFFVGCWAGEDRLITAAGKMPVAMPIDPDEGEREGSCVETQSRPEKCRAVAGAR